MAKTYYELLNEISSDEIYEGFVGYGLFADKIPPVFSSKAFYDYCANNAVQPDITGHEYIYFENIRNINVPRAMGIPNPFAYNTLCKYIGDQWDELLTYFQRKTQGQSYRISRIHPRKVLDKNGEFTKILFDMNFKNLYADGAPEQKMLIGKRFIVNADISNCFPSIYTHALAWALVGKSEAKRRRNEQQALFNLIDKYSRNMKHGETDGLLIGPHVSNLLAEIILVEIDRILFEEGYSFIRHIDDYACFTESYETAQNFINDLVTALRGFDLALNHKKTNIAELPIGLEKEWKRKLFSFSFPPSGTPVTFPTVRNYLDYAIKLAHDSGDWAVLNYAIKVVSGVDNLSHNACEYIVDTVFSLAILFPYLIPLLDDYIFSVFQVNVLRIKEICEAAYSDGLRTRNFEACDYALFYCMKYGIDMDNVALAGDVIATEDCIFLILSALYYKSIQSDIEFQNLLSHARTINTGGVDFDRYWLFVYEMVDAIELSSPWREMKAAGISFIIDEHNVLREE